MNLLAELLCYDHLSCHLAIKSEGSPQSSFTDSLRAVDFVSQHQHRRVGDSLVSEEGLDTQRQTTTLCDRVQFGTLPVATTQYAAQCAAFLSTHRNIQVHSVIFFKASSVLSLHYYKIKGDVTKMWVETRRLDSRQVQTWTLRACRDQRSPPGRRLRSQLAGNSSTLVELSKNKSTNK